MRYDSEDVLEEEREEEEEEEADEEEKEKEEEEAEEEEEAMAAVGSRSVRTIGGTRCPSGPVVVMTNGGEFAASSSIEDMPATGGWLFVEGVLPGTERLPRGDGGDTMICTVTS